MPKTTKMLDKRDLWKRENTKLYQIRIANSSGVPEALEKMTAETGVTATEYLREALLEKLDYDGYIHMEIVKKKSTRRKIDNLIEE